MFSLFNQNSDAADLCWLIAAVLLWLVGLISLMNNNGSKYGWLQGVAWIGTGFIAAGLLFITG